jgi:hypothetical protein
LLLTATPSDLLALSLSLRNRTAEDTVDRDIYDQPVHMYTIYKLDWGDKLVRLENAKSPVITLAAFSSFRRQSPVRRDCL